MEIINKCKKLVVEVYSISDKLPKKEMYGLSSQITRCAVSVGSNIVEGNSRQSKKDYLHFLYISKGSLSELEFQLEIIQEVYDIEFKKENIQEVKRMLNGLISYLKSNI